MMSSLPSTTEPSASKRRRPPGAFALWANPIIRRYARSRLRPGAFGLMLLIVLLLATFIFFMATTAGHHQARLSQVDAYRLPIIPLLVVQVILVFFLGTGQVAGAMTAEADEGVIDYQRLAPMTPLAKVVGYLFGLPIREWLLCLATLPVSAWCLWKGEVPWAASWQLYLTFFVSGVLYHMTGLVTGTVVKNRRWAFLVSMAFVVLLYTVIPQLAKFGLVFFKYLTIWPVVEEFLPLVIPKEAGVAVQTLKELAPDARFFDLNFPQYTFTLLSQGVLILTGIVMLYRRWRRAESHLLGKFGALTVFVWSQILLLGNALPLIKPGTLFPSREINRRFRQYLAEQNWQPSDPEVYAMSTIFGLVLFALFIALIVMITPSHEVQTRGWRRARKLKKSSLSPTSDPATSFWAVCFMIIFGTIGWFVFSRALFESNWFPGRKVSWLTGLGYFFVFATSGFCLQALLEGIGGRKTTLLFILFGVIPIGLGSLFIAYDEERFLSLAIWIMGISPLSSVFFCGFASLPIREMPLELVRVVPSVFWFFQAIYFLVAIVLLLQLRRKRNTIFNKVLAENRDKEPLPSSK